MEYLILVVGLTLIIVGAVMLTDGSVALAKRFSVPEFIVGLTIVAVGTSMPELTVSFFSALKGNGEMAIGNVVGSNIFNTYAILGVCSLCIPILFTQSNIRRDIPMCLLACVALLGVTYFDQSISRIEGAILLAGYAVMMVYSYRAEKRAMLATPECEADGATEAQATMALWRIPVWIIVGLAGLIYGGQLCVDSASAIAHSLGVSDAIIAITLVAGGTSLPELASSLVSIIKGSPSLALGNVIGSNIANILLILGVCSMTSPLTMGNVEMFDIYVMISAVVMLLLAALLIGRSKLTRFEGFIFLAIYGVYVYSLIAR